MIFIALKSIQQAHDVYYLRWTRDYFAFLLVGRTSFCSNLTQRLSIIIKQVSHGLPGRRQTDGQLEWILTAAIQIKESNKYTDKHSNKQKKPWTNSCWGLRGMNSKKLALIPKNWHEVVALTPSSPAFGRGPSRESRNKTMSVKMPEFRAAR